MSGHQPWRDIRDAIRRDPARAARIEAIEREMEREIAAAHAEEAERPDGIEDSTAGDTEVAVASTDRATLRGARKP